MAEKLDRRAQLRVAVFDGDGPGVVAWLRSGGGEPRPEDPLQMIGDGLLTALAQRVPGAPDQAAACVAALRWRDWYGDEELADQLDGMLGAGATPMLRPLPVDLEELAGVLEGDATYGGGRIDLVTGEVWPGVALEYARETGEETEDESEDPDRWLWVDCEGSRSGYRDMEAFIATVSQPGRVDRLEIAIQGRGAFRRFKDVLARWPDELARWYAFSDERQRGRARAWLAAAGYRVAPAREPRPAP